MKSLNTLLGAVAGIGLSLLPIQKTSAQIYGFLGLNSVIQTRQEYSVEVDCVPEYVRDVPAHPDDLDIINPQNVAPIPDSNFNLPFFGEQRGLEIKAGVGIKKGLFNFKFGPKISFIAGEEATPIKERDYLAYPGGDHGEYGSALTYYRLKSEVTSPIEVGGLTEFSLDFNLSKKDEGLILSPFLEYSFLIIPKKFSFETGWNRYNDLEERKSYTLNSHFLNQTVKVGTKIASGPMGVSIFGGMEIIKIMNKTDLARESGFSMDSKPRWFAGILAGFNIDSIMLTGAKFY
jgi:hypothetical protein